MNFLEDDVFEDIEDDCFDSSGPTLSPEAEKELLFFATGFFGELDFIVKNYMLGFFKEQKFSEGGRIPPSVIINKNNVLMVTNYNIITGVDKAYRLLKEQGFACGSSGEVADDIELVVSILNKLSQANIPQQFAGGMVLLYLKLVEGVEIG